MVQPWISPTSVCPWPGTWCDGFSYLGIWIRLARCLCERVAGVSGVKYGLGWSISPRSITGHLVWAVPMYDRMIRRIIYKNKAQFAIPCIDWSLYMRLPRLDSLTIRQLQVFCTVARILAYTRAAEELGCQQPTVSALVAELERAAQLTLLEKRGKHLALTDEGRELYAHAQQVVAAADEAWWAMAERRGSMTTVSRPLRVAADTTVGTYVLPRLLGAFHRRHPNVSLHLCIPNRAAVRASLLAGEVDLVIAGRPPEVEGLVAEPFLANPLVAGDSCPYILILAGYRSRARPARGGVLLCDVGTGERAPA